MAQSGAERQRAYVQRWRDTAALQAGVIEALRTELVTLRAANAALKAKLARARQAAPKPPRRLRDLAQHLYPTVRRSERP
jgi:hypothetical protein